MRSSPPGHDTPTSAPATTAATTPAPGKVTPTGRIARKAAGGAPLPDDVRGRFEASLGGDLGGVRIHTGAESAAAADALGAQAFATGDDVHFAAGRYQPDDPFGLHLLAHEVAHTRQQAGAPGAPQGKLEVSSPGDPAEVEADRAADAMVRGEPVAVTVGAGGVIARKAKGPALAAPGEKPAAAYHTATHAGPNLDKTIDWDHPPAMYNKWGADYGWSRTGDGKAAQEAANGGRVVIIQASKADGASSGHVSAIMAEGNGHQATTSAKGTFQPLQSQAGGSNYEFSDTGGSAALDDWWDAKDMAEEPQGNFFIYQGGHMGTAVAGAKEMGKAT